jgi:hypothetical protein
MAKHVARMHEMRSAFEILVVNLKGRDHLGDTGLGAFINCTSDTGQCAT